MSSFYSNLVQEDTKNTKKKKKLMRVKNAIVLKKKAQKGLKSNFKKTVIISG
jgi:urease gamma subunit